MKTLYLLRHAKSSWDDPALADHDRPLAPRGRRAAKKLSGYLPGAGVVPDLVLCSSSLRTRETFEAIRQALGDPEVRFESELYVASAATLLDTVRGVEPGVASLLVVGHNPGLQGLALALAVGGDEDALRRVGEKLPTGALVTLVFGSEAWGELAAGTGRLVDYIAPREL